MARNKFDVDEKLETPFQWKHLKRAGVYILHCADDSPALKAGLQRGDILIDFGGTAIRSVDDLRTVLLNYTTEQTASVIVLRKGRSGYQEISYNVPIERR